MKKHLLAALFLAACHKEPKPTQEYLNAMKEADAAFRARDNAAEIKALTIASDACIQKDCAFTKFNLANALAAGQKNDEAFALYQQIVKEYPKSEEAPKALVNAAKLRANNGSEERDLLYQAIKQDPNNVAAARAVDLLLNRAKEKGLPEEARTDASRKSCGASPECAAPKGALAAREECTLLLAALNPKIELTSLILFRRADLSDELGEPDAALADEELIIKKGEKFPQFDDACWRATQRHLKKDEIEPAMKVLETLTETREKSFAMGSVNSQYLDDAFLLLGDLYAQQGNTKEAIANYNKLFKYFKQSILRDDTLWKIANLTSLSTKERCDALSKLQTEFSDSRYIKKSQELQTYIPCP